MERSDNNRGGYNRGRGRGGRNYGGPQHGGRGGDGGGNGNYGGGQYGGRGGDGGGNGNYGGAQYGGRGGDGGGSGAGYYPRGRGRSGNNPQQYSNQRQEQYGGDGGGDGNYGGGQYGGRGGDGNYGGGQYGGRGGDGGGTGAGYYPRGRGRSGNYPQQHNNQQQEQYGGGRGRGSVGRGGGRGGDQPTYWNPTQSRQNADRVTDHSVRDRETKWSPTGSDHSVESPPPALTQIQNRVADLQIREPPRRQVERVSPSMDNEETANVPIKRPDYGTLGFRTVKLLVNHFPVRFDPSTAILRYDIDVKHDTASSSRAIKKAIPKSDLRLIQEKLCSENPNQFPLLQTAYDGEKNIYSAVKLPEGIYKVDLFGRSYTCSIKYGTELGLSKLQDFLKGNSIQIPREVLQALDVVMKANLYREKVSVGRGMYPRVHRKEDDLYGGVAAYRGSQQSLKVTSNGLVMCLDYSAVPFRKRMPVIDFLKECIWDIRDVNDIGKFGNKVVTALRGLRVGVTHRRTNQKYIVSGLTEMATKDISFELEDLEGKKETEVVMLTDYFREKWGKEIVYTGIPCLKLGSSKKPNYVPMEFCVLAEDRRFPKEQLGREAAKMLKDLSLLNPDCRRNEIRSMVRDEYAAGKNGAKVIKNFDFEVGMNMTEVTGRVMAPPQLKLGTLSGKTNTTTVDKVKCHWNLMNGKTLTEGKAAQRWALIDFTLNDRRNSLRDPNYFISKLINRCKSIGIEMENPIIVHPTNMREFSDINKLDRLLKQVVENCRRVDKGRLQMIVCVMADKHEGYKYLKWVSETQIGVITQCCLAQNANKANDQFLANLGMKINAKLGGSNVELIERFPLFDSNDRFMFIGADVNHPAASNQSSPSVAAVVGSVNFPAATRYAARVSPQTHRKEEIVNFGSLCVDLVNAYVQQNGVKPNRIIVFRDGVSDGQFDMVLNKEMVDMKKALYNHFDQNYRPFITYVVAQKRHTTRLFLNNGTEVGNVPPGTVVDTTIVQPFEFDFYLCSHFGGMGTSKATHYSVIWDENGFTSDEMQKLVYHLCYVFARCTKPVSLVPPVYYADLVAYRGRMFQEVAAESDTGSRSSGSEVSVCSFDRFFYDVEKSLKDSMFFI